MPNPYMGTCMFYTHNTIFFFLFLNGAFNFQNLQNILMYEIYHFMHSTHTHTHTQIIGDNEENRRENEERKRRRNKAFQSINWFSNPWTFYKAGSAYKLEYSFITEKIHIYIHTFKISNSVVKFSQLYKYLNKYFVYYFPLQIIIVIVHLCLLSIKSPS